MKLFEKAMVYFQEPLPSKDNFNSLFFSPIPVQPTIKPEEINNSVNIPEAPYFLEEPKLPAGRFSLVIRIIGNILLILTILPLLVKIFIEYHKQKNYYQLLNELQKLKWRGFFYANSLDFLIGAAHHPQEFKKRALTFIKNIECESSIKDLIIKDLEKEHFSQAFRKLKEHTQITSFYKAASINRSFPSLYRDKITKAFKMAKAYMDGGLKKIEKSRALYGKITSIRSHFLITHWMEAIYMRNEISLAQYELLLSLLKRENAPDFICSLKEIVLEKIKRLKSEEPNIGYFFYKEIWDALVHIDASKGIHELGEFLSPLFFYQNLFSQLEALENEMGSILDNKMELSQEKWEQIKSKIKESEAHITTSIASDILAPPLFDYQFRTMLGFLRRKFANINDKIAALEKASETHKVCGCHYSYSEDDVFKKRNFPFSKQVVDVKRSRMNLEKKFQAVNAKLQEFSLEPMEKKQILSKKIQKLHLKSTLLKTDIQALKISEKGCVHIKKNIKKPLLLGLTCSFGSGHKSPTAAVAKLIGNMNAHFSVADGPDEILKPACFFYKMGKFFGEDWKKSDAYSYIIQKQWFWIPRLYLKITQFIAYLIAFFSGLFSKLHLSLLKGQDSKEKELIRKRLLMEMPDHLMTFYHMDLALILDVAEEMGIPVTHFATDFNAKMQEVFKDIPPSHPLFKLILTNNTQASLDSAKPIKQNDVIPSSGPIRPLFLTKTKESTLKNMRKERGIDPSTSTILFMSGGFGQSIHFPEELATSAFTDKLHLIVIAGGNKEFGDHFEDLVKKGVLKKEGNFYRGTNPQITIEVAKDPATKTKNAPYYIGEAALNRYFDLADVLYTKPGGSTTLEALEKGLMTVFDNRSALMYWEEDNMNQVIALGKGVKNSKNTEFIDDLKKAIALSKKKERNYRNLPPMHQVLSERMKIHNEELSAWQIHQFSHYRFDLNLNNGRKQNNLLIENNSSP